MNIPKSIKRIKGEGLEITWSDDRTVHIPAHLLRANCPSAESRVERGDSSHDAPLPTSSTRKRPSGLSVVSHSKEETLSIERIWPVGRYAIGIEWGDNRKSGIYSFELLEQLSQMEK